MGRDAGLEDVSLERDAGLGRDATLEDTVLGRITVWRMRIWGEVSFWRMLVWRGVLVEEGCWFREDTDLEDEDLGRDVLEDVNFEDAGLAGIFI